MDTSWTQLAKALLSPARPRLPQCRARAEALAARESRLTERRTRALAECRDRIEAARASVFETGNGVVGADMTALEREWLQLARPRSPAETTRELWLEMAPRRWADTLRWQQAGDRHLDVETAITLACDPDGVERAEQHARELAAALAAWNVDVGEHTSWRVAAQPEPAPRLAELLAAPLAALDDVVASTYGATSLVARADRIAADVRGAVTGTPLVDRHPTLAADVALVARIDFLWRACVTEARVVPSGLAPAGRPFAALVNPAAALLALWSTGYVVCAAGPEGITLGASTP